MQRIDERRAKRTGITDHFRTGERHGGNIRDRNHGKGDGTIATL